MKKFTYLCLVLLLSSCASLNTLRDNTNEKKESNIGVSWNNSTGDLKTQQIILNSSAPEGILSDISNSLKRGYVREYNTTYRDNYEVYVGDYVSIPLGIGEDSYNVLFSPLGASYELELREGKLFFRGIYQGSYEIMLYSAGSFSRKITIQNKLKYEFTEQNNYEVISQSYKAGNMKVLSDSVAVHRIAFPNSFRDKEISFMLIDLAGRDGNSKVIKEEIDFLQKYTKLDEYDKLNIINSLKLIQDKNFELNSALLEFDSSSQNLNQEIVKLITAKENPTQDEIIFLEKVYSSNSTPDVALGTFIGNWYIKNGNPVKGASYLNGNGNLGNIGELLPTIPTTPVETTESSNTVVTPENLEAQNYTQYLTFFEEGKKNFEKENYVEAALYFEKALEIDKNYIEKKDIYFYLGQSHFRTDNYSEAVKDYKNSLNLEKNDEKKAEIYYNIGMTYDKLGDSEQAVNYLTYVRQNYKNSPWSVKSSLYLLQQMQQYPQN